MGMARFIDLDKTLKRLEKEVWWTESEKSAMRQFLYKSREADAVPVVRCKDCKHYCQYPKVDKPKACFVHPLTPHFMPEDGFCSYGERREGE